MLRFAHSWLRLIKNAEEEKAVRKLLNDDVQVFNATRYALNSLMKSPRRGHLNFYETVLYDDEYKCKVKFPWKSQYPNHLSFAFPKNSPLFPFFDYQVLKMMETGTMDLIRRKWTGSDRQCTDQEDKELEEDVGLSFNKLVGLFLVCSIGAVLAILIFTYEVANGVYRKLPMRRVDDSELEYVDRYTRYSQDGNGKKVMNKMSNLFIKWNVQDWNVFMTDMEELFQLKKES